MRERQSGNVIEITVILPAVFILIIVVAVETYRALNTGIPPGWVYVAMVGFIALGVGLLSSLGVELKDRFGWGTTGFWALVSSAVTVAAAAALWRHEGWRFFVYEAVAAAPLAMFLLVLVNAVRDRRAAASDRSKTQDGG